MITLESCNAAEIEAAQSLMQLQEGWTVLRPLSVNNNSPKETRNTRNEIKKKSKKTPKFRPSVSCLATLNTEKSSTISTTEKTYPCVYVDCNKVYRKGSHLKAHIRTHTGERPYPCLWKGCDRKFARSDELKRHMRIHKEERIYVCKKCTSAFTRSDHLRKHERRHMYKFESL